MGAFFKDQGLIRLFLMGLGNCERIKINFYRISFGRDNVTEMLSFTVGYLHAKQESCLFYSHS